MAFYYPQKWKLSKSKPEMKNMKQSHEFIHSYKPESIPKAIKDKSLCIYN